jgi:uncharacterized protein (DUF2132 family)
LLANVTAAVDIVDGAMTQDRSDSQPNNPLHGVTLAAILDYLVATIGWAAMARAVDVRCFTNEPSIPSSLKFLRKVPWARTKVEELYLRTKARQRRS